MTTYITKDAPFFSGSPLLRIPQLSVLAMGAILRWMTSWEVSQVPRKWGWSRL